MQLQASNKVRCLGIAIAQLCCSHGEGLPAEVAQAVLVCCLEEGGLVFLRAVLVVGQLHEQVALQQQTATSVRVYTFMTDRAVAEQWLMCMLCTCS